MVLVAEALRERGADVVVAPFRVLRDPGLLLALDFVLLFYLRKTNEHNVRALLDAGIRVGILDAEGGVMPGPETFAMKLTDDRELLRRVSLFCSWGRLLADYALGQRWFEPGAVAVTGAPRFDFYVPPLSRVALDLSSEIEGIGRPMVLINTRFSLANPEFITPERQRETFVRAYGMAEGQVAEWQAIQRKAMREMAEMTNRLAALLPGTNFVFRPHPFEDPSPYGELLERRPNIHLIRRGTIDGWILRSCAVIHRCCSTAIEAGMAGVPAFSPRWIAMNQEIESAESVSVPCGDFEGLAAGIGLATRGEFSVPPPVGRALDRTVEDWFLARDGRSHERVADAILRACGPASPGAARARCRQIYYKRHRPGGGKGTPLAHWVAWRLSRALRWPCDAVARLLGVRDWPRVSKDRDAKSYSVADVRRLSRAILAVRRAWGPRVARVRLGVWPGGRINGSFFRAPGSAGARRRDSGAGLTV